MLREFIADLDRSWPRYLRRLHQIERDYFGADPTEIDVPAGVGPE
jgi:hypothetical protein